ncbi:MAG: DUF3047 domain-containing protein [Candidatus Omnitrophota bacterium]
MGKIKRFDSFLVIIIIFFIVLIFFVFFAPSLKIDKRFIPEAVFKGVAWFKFDDQNGLAGWQEKIFKGRVFYNLKKSDSNGYLDAYSDNAASGIFHWLKFNLKNDPMVSWKWKVIKFPEKKGGPVAQTDNWIEQDDYAARFYVIFPRFPFFKLKALEYVWDKDLPKETVLQNPKFKNLKIIVAESGEKNKGKWVTVERNVYDDFKRVFAQDPPEAGAIAVMTDTENTASTAHAEYDEIKVGYGKK